jgi:hypothetical protein
MHSPVGNVSLIADCAWGMHNPVGKVSLIADLCTWRKHSPVGKFSLIPEDVSEESTVLVVRMVYQLTVPEYSTVGKDGLSAASTWGKHSPVGKDGLLVG